MVHPRSTNLWDRTMHRHFRLRRLVGHDKPSPTTNPRRLSRRRARQLLGPERLESRTLLTTQVGLGRLLLDGTFQQSGNTYTATDLAVEIGLAPTGSESYTPLTVWTGDMSFTSGGSSFVFSGSIEALEQSSATVAVAQIGTTQTFAVDALTSTGVGIGGGAAVGVERGHPDAQLDCADRSARGGYRGFLRDAPGHAGILGAPGPLGPRLGHE